MFIFYLLATIFLFGGAAAWVKCRQFVLWECAVASATGFAIAAIFQVCVNTGMTRDVETWSGKIEDVRHYPPWTEYYEYAVYRTETHTHTTSDGRGGTTTYTTSEQVFDHWQPSTRYHSECWDKHDSFGRSWKLNPTEYKTLLALFGGTEDKEPGHRTTSDHNSRMTSGDPLDYYALNTKQYVEPVTKWSAWTNRVRASPSTFCFQQVPEGSPVFPYPKNENPFLSDRLMGAATVMVPFMWDQMNARLGPWKKVNVIAIGFSDADQSMAELQRASYVGGKKNDIVICYGGPNTPHASWCTVFGWSDSEFCKRNLETLFMTRQVNATLIPAIEKEIATNYQIKDWTQFDYLTVEPPGWTYGLFLGVVVLVQGGVWAFFYCNQVTKLGKK